VGRRTWPGLSLESLTMLTAQLPGHWEWWCLHHQGEGSQWSDHRVQQRPGFFPSVRVASCVALAQVLNGVLSRPQLCLLRGAHRTRWQPGSP
jgi:hypothetical protein